MTGNAAFVADACDQQVLAEGDGAGADGGEGDESALNQLDLDEHLRLRRMMRCNQNGDVAVETDLLSCAADLFGEARIIASNHTACAREQILPLYVSNR